MVAATPPLLPPPPLLLAATSAADDDAMFLVVTTTGATETSSPHQPHAPSCTLMHTHAPSCILNSSCCHAPSCILSPSSLFRKAQHPQAAPHVPHHPMERLAHCAPGPVRQALQGALLLPLLPLPCIIHGEDGDT